MYLIFFKCFLQFLHFSYQNANDLYFLKVVLINFIAKFFISFLFLKFSDWGEECSLGWKDRGRVHY